MTCSIYRDVYDHPDLQVLMTVVSWCRHPTASGFRHGFCVLECGCSVWINSKTIITDESYWNFLKPGARTVGDLRVEKSKTGVPRFVGVNVEILRPENSDEGET